MRSIRVVFSVLAVALLAGCSTPEGPRLPLPSQQLSAPVPAGYARVVFFNGSFEALHFESGNIRIQLDGKTAPSLYLNHYSQLFLKPGKYQLLLEHFDLVTFKDTYEIEIGAPETLIRVWCTPIATRYEIVDALPPDFKMRFIGGRDPSEWPAFTP